MGPVWHGGVLGSGYHRLETGCPPGWVSIWRRWRKIHFQACSCWQKSIPHTRRTAVSILLLAVSRGHSQLWRPPTFLDTWVPSSSSQQGHFGSLTSSSTTSQSKLCAFKSLVWLNQAHFKVLRVLRSTHCKIPVQISVWLNNWEKVSVYQGPKISEFCLPHWPCPLWRFHNLCPTPRGSSPIPKSV